MAIIPKNGLKSKTMCHPKPKTTLTIIAIKPQNPTNYGLLLGQVTFVSIFVKWLLLVGFLRRVFGYLVSLVYQNQQLKECYFYFLPTFCYTANFLLIEQSMNHTTIIVLITVIISIIAWQDRRVMGRLIFDPISITRFKQYDRFLTHGLIHADAMHLLFNMFTLYSFGRVLERFYIDQLGNLGFVCFYVLAIIIAIIPTFIKHKNNPRYLGLGASGAVSAVLFAYILFAPWNLIYFFGIIPIPAILFAVLYTAYEIYNNKKGTSNINHSAHLYGAGFGIIATLAIEPMVFIYFIDQLVNPRF